MKGFAEGPGCRKASGEKHMGSGVWDGSEFCESGELRGRAPQEGCVVIHCSCITG